MDATTQADLAIGKARGRKDSEGQEAVIKEKPLKDSLSELMALKSKFEQAKEKLSDAINAVAEKCGMQAKVVRRAVNAKATDKIEEAERDAEQLTIALGVMKKG